MPLHAHGARKSIHYPANHQRQRQITTSIVTNAVIDGSQPLSLIEQRWFRNLLKDLHPQYQPVCKTTISSRVNDIFHKMKIDLQSLMSDLEVVHLTTDIWTDRKMRSFCGITGHYLADDITLKSCLLSCDRFTGRHTGERIADKFQEVLQSFKIEKKIG